MNISLQNAYNVRIIQRNNVQSVIVDYGFCQSVQTVKNIADDFSALFDAYRLKSNGRMLVKCLKIGCATAIKEISHTQDLLYGMCQSHKKYDKPMVESALEFMNGTAKYSIYCDKYVENSQEFNDLPLIGEAKIGIADLLTIKPLLAKCSTDEMRTYLQGIYIKGYTASATDGHRLAILSLPVNTGIDGILPAQAMKQMFALADRARIDAKKAKKKLYCWIAVKDGFTRFKFGKDNIIIKHIRGDFPEYERVIPKENKLKMSVYAPDLLKAIKRIDLFSDESSAVRFVVNGKRLDLITRSQECGELTETVACKSKAELEIGYNARYLKDILQGVKGDIEFAWRDSATASIITTDNSKLTTILMPMRV